LLVSTSHVRHGRAVHRAAVYSMRGAQGRKDERQRRTRPLDLHRMRPHLGGTSKPQVVIHCIQASNSLYMRRWVCEVQIAYALTRQDCVAYLRAESRSLVEQGDALHQEFEQLRRTPSNPERCRMFCYSLHAYRGLLANHALAVKWLIHPPGSVHVSSLPSVSERPAA